MIVKRIMNSKDSGKHVKAPLFLGITVLAFLIAVLAGTACKSSEEAGEAGSDSALLLKEGIIEFEGTAKVCQGEFLYVPEAQGFDIVVQGPLTSGDLNSLIGKPVRGRGEFTPEYPSILAAVNIEVMDESGVWNPVFTRTEDLVLDNYLNLQSRDEYQIIKDLAYNKNEGWESLEKAKVYGSLEENEEGAYIITAFNDKDQDVGKILVDNIDDFALFYVKKLNLFDKFWFYLTIKETVDWSVRRSTNELFHADVQFAGLF